MFIVVGGSLPLSHEGGALRGKKLSHLSYVIGKCENIRICIERFEHQSTFIMWVLYHTYIGLNS